MCGVPVLNYFFQNRKIASNRYKIVLLYSSTHRSTIHFPVHSTQRWQNLVCIQTGSYQMNMMSVIVIIINYKYYYDGFCQPLSELQKRYLIYEFSYMYFY